MHEKSGYTSYDDEAKPYEPDLHHDLIDYTLLAITILTTAIFYDH